MICQVKIWLLKTDSFAHPYLPFWKLFWAYCNRTEHFCSVSHCRSYKNCKYVSYRNLFDHPHKHRVQTRLVSECARLGLLFESHGVMSLDDFADPCRHRSSADPRSVVNVGAMAKIGVTDPDYRSGMRWGLYLGFDCLMAKPGKRCHKTTSWHHKSSWSAPSTSFRLMYGHLYRCHLTCP